MTRASLSNGPMLTYRPKIDGLRGLAILAVVAYHYWPSVLPFGYVGVDLFFVISGYLITQILLDSHFTFLDFYFRRARRLGPALILATLFILVVASPGLWPYQLVGIGRQALSAALLYPNIHLYRVGTNYFSAKASELPFAHYWSLGVEEQFYLFYPAFLMTLAKFRHKVGVTRFGLIMLATVSFLLMILLQGKPAAFFLPFTRIWEMLVGCTLAHTQRHGGKNHYLVAALAAVIVALLYSLKKGFETWPNFWVVVPVALGAFSIEDRDESRFGRILSWPILVGIGLISYPLYLFHPPMLMLMTNLLGESPLAGIIALAASIGISWIVYRYVEAPIRAIRFRDLSRVQATAGIFAPPLFIVLAAAVVILTNGFPGRFRAIRNFDQTVAQLDPRLNPEKEETLWEFVRLMKAGLRPELYLSSGDYEKTETWILGDSHAWHLYYGLARLPVLARGGTTLFARGTSPTISNVELIYASGHRLGVADWNDKLNKFVTSQTQGKSRLIVLSFIGPALFHGKGVGRVSRTDIKLERRGNLAASTEEAFFEGLSETIRQLGEANSRNRLVFALDVPEMAFNPPGGHLKFPHPWPGQNPPGGRAAGRITRSCCREQVSPLPPSVGSSFPRSAAGSRGA